MGMEVRLALSKQEYRHSNKSYNTPYKNKHNKDIFSNYTLELAQSLSPESFAVLCQSTNFVRKVGEREREGGGGGWISLLANSWNRILHPPGIGLPCVGWYKAYLEIRSPWLGAPKTMAHETDLPALTDWGPTTGTTSLLLSTNSVGSLTSRRISTG